MKILVLDDFKADREMLAQPFRGEHQVRCATDLEDAACILEHWWPDVALVDAIFPKRRNGPPVFAVEFFLELLEGKRTTYPEMPQIIVVSGQNETAKRFDEVRNWLRYGRVADVIPKSAADVGIEFFRAVVQMRVEMLLDRQRWRGIQNSAESASEWFAQLGIITRSPRMLALKVALMAAARSSSCVLLSGPTGSGKELFAKAIHSLSRPDKAFREENCGAIPPQLFESEMFGVQGYGRNNTAYSQKPGYLASVGDGTLFLDEIHNLDFAHQGKLLHVLQERKFRPVGATDDTPFLGKFIVATNERLRENVEKGKFREDLYFRVAAFDVQIPALADRMEDVPILADHFLREFVRARRAENRPCPEIHLHPKCLTPLSSYTWRGNVRELKNAIDKAAEYAIGESLVPEATITPELLVNCNPYLEALRPQLPSHDPLLASGGIAVRSWSELTEKQLDQAIYIFLSDEGRIQFEAMRGALVLRDPGTAPDVPGRHSQDPATIHCLKALLYFLLRTDHRASVQDLLGILGLTAWASGKKVMTVLAGEDPTIVGCPAFVKLPSKGSRQEAQLLPGYQRPSPDRADPSTA
jgi:DNA-binding NtrC family response regulator